MMLQVVQDTASAGVGEQIKNFIEAPGPAGPFKIYLVVMFVLWLLALRSRHKKTFEKQAQEVLDEKYASGELTKKSYDKFRQDVSLRPKR
jgi:hypothetical protein